MADFIYKAIDPASRRQVSVNITAANEAEANKLIMERGLRPLSVKEAGTGGGLGGLFSFLKRGVKRKDKILFTAQLSTLISAGLPLLQALKSVADQTANKELKAITLDIVTGIEGGIGFSESLKKYPHVFDNIFVNLIRAGEASGTLDISLERLAEQQEKDGELVSKVKSAMVYPAIVMVVMVAVVVFMLVFVLPQVESFYAGLPDDEPLPWITRFLLAISNGLQQFWYFIIGAVFLLVIAVRWWTKTDTGRASLDQLKLRGPGIKNLYQKVYMARFTRTVGTLFGSGVNLIQTLEIIQGGINNVHMEASIGRSINMVQEGSTLSIALSNDPNFLDLVPDMVRIGEQSGKTEEMLMKAAVYYEKEVDKQIQTLTTIMEPILILTLGGIAITIVLAILLPIYSVVNKNFL
ncbi:type II secretion system F family protein [Candidatus Saccharibacteria bacterium]|nr:type II secretion system F family protein [Candidatus Saccharibacteria bacterium]